MPREKRAAKNRNGTCVLFAALFLSVLSVFPPPLQAQAPVRQEYELKAGFLYQFTQFVEWPPERIDGQEKFTVCVLEDNGRLPDEFRLLQQEEVYGLGIDVRSAEENDLDGCHAVFVPFSKRRELNDILEKIEGRPVLTVGESAGFIERGGIINFTRQGRKIRFEINQKSAEKAGLKISSKLLKLATRVIT